MRRYFIRNLDGPDLFLTFLISAIAAILAIRFFLYLSGYPQLGPGGLHIAHMLWGGLLLLVAAIMLLGFLDRPTQRVAAVVGGLGWGTFIDELGKFITQDHNYFFAPTIALIYVSFVTLYLAFQAVARATALTDDEYEANAMRIIEEAIVHGLTVDRRARVQEYLARTRGFDPIAHAIADLLRTLDAAPAPPPSRLQRLHDWLMPRYAELSRRRAFRVAVELIVCGHILFGTGQAIMGAQSVLAWAGTLRAGSGGPPFADLGTLICSGLAALFAIAGIAMLPRSRMRAYHCFRTAVLISILLTQFFVFLQDQFAALPGFALNLGILIVLGELMNQEHELATAGAVGMSSAGYRQTAMTAGQTR
jgi:hypothetical protein